MTSKAQGNSPWCVGHMSPSRAKKLMMNVDLVVQNGVFEPLFGDPVKLLHPPLSSKAIAEMFSHLFWTIPGFLRGECDVVEKDLGRGITEEEPDRDI